MNQNRLAAVINCGSSSIRLVIGEFDLDNKLRVLDSAVKFIGLGKDVFTVGAIRRKTMVQALQIFLQYKELLAGWGITPKEARVIGTSALRESRNRDTFIDRLEVRTGFRLNVIEGIEENRLTYMAVQFAFKDILGQLGRQNSMIIEVGGGSTEVMLLRRGKMCAAHSLNFGTVRIEENYRDRQSLSIGTKGILQNLRPFKEMLDSELKLSSVRYVLAVGNYAKIAAEARGRQISDFYSVIDREALGSLAEELANQSLEDTVRILGIPFPAAEGLASALAAYDYFLEDAATEEILVLRGGISEGLLSELGPGIDPDIQNRFNAQIISSALSVGKKYHFDQVHARHVAENSLALFDQLAKEHNLGPRQRLLLEVSALLHDIGTFIRFSGHHKHGQYLVDNSEIFGLDPRDIRIVSNIVRYHRKSMPNSSHVNFSSLPREDRLIVLKLASLLRVADALDRGHSQRIQKLRVEKKEEEIWIRAEYEGDISAERFSLSTKGSMFEEVFGLKVTLI